jgi:inner membrane protein
MEPVTHFLAGACMGRAGLNRKTAYATLAATLAAEAADLDVVWSLAGPVAALKHHRGITHTFWAVPVVAGVVVGAIWLYNRWRPQRPNAQPVHWGWLYLTAFVAALSHLLLDWTNNYGVRPFFPFNAHWYAGSFMFIAEPVLWALFFLAFVMPWLLALADREIGARQKNFRGQGWAIFALCGMLILGCLRWSEHARALTMLNDTPITSESALRAAAEPYPINPFHWHGIVETADFYQTAEIDTRTGAMESDPRQNVLFKPSWTPSVETAKHTPLGQVYLDWGSWAVVRDLGQQPIPGLAPPQLAPLRSWTTVGFSDLRFDYAYLPARRREHLLSGMVYVVDGREEAGAMLNGKIQK